MPAIIDVVEASLLDDPEDAAAWARYAALLLAQGDARGERITLSLAGAPEPSTGRADRAPAGVWPDDCEWRHGFVVGATLRIAGRGDARRLEQLMADPRSRLLGSLRIVVDPATPARGLALLAAADLGRLRSLRAAYHARGNRVVRALVRQPALSLRTLDLRHAGLTDDAVIALARCEQLRGLRALYLQHNRLTARGVSALALAPALARLELLDLRHNAIGTAGAAALAESPQLGALRSLYLYAGELEPAGVHALASSTTLPRDLVRYWRAQERP